MSLICLVFGAIIIVILCRVAFGLSLATLFKNHFFWLSLACLAALLLYIIYSPVAAQAKTSENTAELPLPPSDTPPQQDNWEVLEAELQGLYQNANYAIYAEDLTDASRKILVNAETEMPTASVYKLAVAYSMLRAVAAGASWNSLLWNTTLENCFDKIIIESNNECAHAWGDQHGWRAVTSEFAELGLHINLYGQTSATAKDIAGFLKKIYRGQILNDGLIDKLMNAMKAQRYRQGVPAGAPSKTVANKVGFMNEVLNDAAIVFGPSGNYVLVIFTKGYSWDSIAKTAELIDESY